VRKRNPASREKKLFAVAVSGIVPIHVAGLRETSFQSKVLFCCIHTDSMNQRTDSPPVSKCKKERSALG